VRCCDAVALAISIAVLTTIADRILARDPFGEFWRAAASQTTFCPKKARALSRDSRDHIPTLRGRHRCSSIGVSIDPRGITSALLRRTL